MNSIQEIKDLADIRLKEAKILLENGCPDGAFYLGGYAVELGLKVLVCKNLGIEDFFADNSSAVTGSHKESIHRTLRVHDFSRLIIFTGLLEEHKTQKSNDAYFLTNWSNVDRWNEKSRYKNGEVAIQDAQTFLDSMENPTKGIFTWIKNHW